MSPLALCASLALIGHCLASQLQRPRFTQCTDVGDISKDVQIKNLAIVNAKVGEDVTVTFTIKLEEESDLDGKVNLTMTDSNGKNLPCVLGVGTCEFDVCNPTTFFAKQVAASWGSKCPIPAGRYQVMITHQIPSFVRYIIGDGNIKARFVIYNSQEIFDCEDFTIEVEK